MKHILVKMLLFANIVVTGQDNTPRNNTTTSEVSLATNTADALSKADAGSNANTPGRGGWPPNTISADVSEALHIGTNAVLYSLEPREIAGINDKSFHGTKIIGQAELNSQQTVIAAKYFEASIAPVIHGVGACFEPRHGLRLASNGHIYDFSLCFACGHLVVFKDDKQIADLIVEGSAKDLNSLLTSLKLPLSPSGIATDEQQNKVELNRARWFAAMPKSLQSFWSQAWWGRPHFDVEPLRAPLAEEFPDPTQRILVLFAWYGSGAGPWSGYSSYEDAAKILLLDFSTSELVTAIQKRPSHTGTSRRRCAVICGIKFNRAESY